MVGEDDEEPPLRQEKRFLKNQRLKFKVGVVLQHMDVAHEGALLRVGEGSFLHILVQLDGGACGVGNGACAAKKLEANRKSVRSDVDFVLTFEELAGIIEGKDLDIDLLEVDENEAALCSASAAGRGFAQSGGVAKAVADKIKEWHPDMDVKIASAQGLADCKKLLMLAKAGKYNGYLLRACGS